MTPKEEISQLKLECHRLEQRVAELVADSQALSVIAYAFRRGPECDSEIQNQLIRRRPQLFLRDVAMYQAENVVLEAAREYASVDMPTHECKMRLLTTCRVNLRRELKR